MSICNALLTEHNLVGRLSVYVGLFEVTTEHLQVSTAAINVLLLIFVGHLVELGRQTVEAGALNKQMKACQD